MPKADWKRQMLTREDIGYGPARPYEALGGQGGEQLRERRGVGRSDEGRSEARAEAHLGPYQRRLQRRQRPDPWIKAELEEQFFLDTWIDADRITIDVKNGIVTLLGTMPARAEIDRILEDVRRVPGITQFRNRLEVET